MLDGFVEPFRTDCQEWRSYKPCDVQREQGLPDCVGCESFVPAEPLIDVNTRSMEPGDLTAAESIGIVEMGGLGSILRTTAVSHALRVMSPGVDIQWYTHERAADLLRYVPGVEGVDTENTPIEEVAQHVSSLDVVINFDTSKEASEVVRHAGVVGGFAVNPQGKFYPANPDATYMQHMQVDDEFRQVHQLTMQQALLADIGLDYADPMYDVVLGQHNYENARSVTQDLFGESDRERLVGLNIGTSTGGDIKRWPAERYAALAAMLSNSAEKTDIVILSGPEDEEARHGVKKNLAHSQTRAQFAPGDMDVGDFIALVGECDLVVTGDTFGFHAAKSVDVPAIVIGDPAPTNEVEATELDSVVTSGMDCAPCYGKCSQNVRSSCMQSVGVSPVRNIVTKTLQVVSSRTGMR